MDFQSRTKDELRRDWPSLSWDVTHPRLAVGYQSLGTVYRSSRHCQPVLYRYIVSILW